MECPSSGYLPVEVNGQSATRQSRPRGTPRSARASNSRFSASEPDRGESASDDPDGWGFPTRKGRTPRDRNRLTRDEFAWSTRESLDELAHQILKIAEINIWEGNHPEWASQHFFRAFPRIGEDDLEILEFVTQQTHAFPRARPCSKMVPLPGSVRAPAPNRRVTIRPKSRFSRGSWTACELGCQAWSLRSFGNRCAFNSIRRD